MLNIIQTILSYFVTITFNLIIYVVIFQFLLEVVGSVHHHPIRQYFLRYTQPLLDPIHRIIPNYRDIDLALLGYKVFGWKGDWNRWVKPS